MIVKEHPVSGYGISTCGKVFNKKGVQLQGTIIHSGYRQVYVNVSPPSGLVHRAVYETFVGAIPDGLCINHKDGDKLNNNLSNLECVTYSENANHAYANNLSVGIRGEDRHDSTLTNENVLQMYNLFKLGYNNDQVGSIYSVHPRYVSLIRHGKRWKHLYSEPMPKSFNYKYSPESVIEALLMIRAGVSNIEVSKALGIEKSSVSRLRTGALWADFVSWYDQKLAA